MAGKGSHEIEAAVTVCNALWGPKLTFQCGRDKIAFSALIPTPSELVEIYRDGKLHFANYELIALLLVTNSCEHLAALLDAKAVTDDQRFSFGDDNNYFTLAHLACAVGARNIVTKLCQDGRVFNSKDCDGCTPISVCFNGAVRTSLPKFKKMFHKAPVEQPLRAVKKKEIFELAKRSTNFYKLIVEMQKHLFDVNLEQNDSGDLMVHIATNGGLPSLPLLLFLVNSMGADINSLNSKGLTPLCLACSCGYVKMAEVMVCVLGADINVTNSFGQTPLHYAAKYGHARTVSMLLRQGVDAGREDHFSQVAEILAWQRQEMECVQLIRKHNEERCVQLSQEIMNSQLKVSSLFPSDYCVVTKEGYTLLMLAVLHNQKDLVHQLVTHDQCPRNFVHYPTKKTAVTMAAELCNVECLKTLLDAGCYPHVPNQRNRLPIHYAAENGNALCVELITRLESGDGLKSLQLAKQLGGDNKEIISLLDRAQSRRQEQIVTPHLFQAGMYGDKDGTLYYRLEDGDDINPINQDGDWPLLVATRHCHYPIVKLLCEQGGNVTQKQLVTKEMPLHLAAKLGRNDIVKLLLDHGASQCIDEVTSYGATPLELAANQGHAKAVELLLEYGATTALPDSSGKSLLQAPNYPGVQFRLDHHRRMITDRIVQALQRPKRITLKEFQSIWKGPHYHNYRDRYGNTMVMVAISSNSRYEILSFLLESANSSHDNLFVTPAATMSNGLDGRVVSYDNSDDLPRPGSTLFINEQKDTGASHYAVEYRSLSVVPESFNDDKKVDHMTPCHNILHLANAHNGQTALHEAVKMNDASVVKLLLRCDSSCANIQDHHGNTALHLACQRHKPNDKIVQTLMEHTDVTLRRNDQKMAEDLCLSKKLKQELSARWDRSRNAVDLSSDHKQMTSPPDVLTLTGDTNPFDSRHDHANNDASQVDHNTLDENLKQLHVHNNK